MANQEFFQQRPQIHPTIYAYSLIGVAFQIPMMFVRSGLAIPVDTERYTENVDTPETAQWTINKMLYDLDNQLNMDW